MLLSIAASACAQPGGQLSPIRYQRSWDKVLNVRAYGAQGDSTTVDTLAFQRAISAMNPYNTLLVPADSGGGSYYVPLDSLVLPIGAKLTGGGHILLNNGGYIRIESEGFVDDIYMRPYDTSGVVYDTTGDLGVYLWLGKAAGGVSNHHVNQLTGAFLWIKANQVTNLRIENCEFRGQDYSAGGSTSGSIVLTSCYNWTIYKTHIWYSGKNEISIYADGTNGLIDECLFTGRPYYAVDSAGHSGFWFSTNNAEPPTGGHKLKVRNSVFANHGRHNGIDINPAGYGFDDSLGITIEGCEIYGNYSPGIYVKGSNVTISDNDIYLNGTAGIRILDGANVGLWSTHNTITNNRIWSNDTANATSDYQIQLDSVAHSTIIGNKIYRTADYNEADDEQVFLRGFDNTLALNHLWQPTTGGLASGSSSILIYTVGASSEQDSNWVYFNPGQIVGSDSLYSNMPLNFPNLAGVAGTVDSFYVTYSTIDSIKGLAVNAAGWVTPGDSIWVDTSGGAGATDSALVAQYAHVSDSLALALRLTGGTMAGDIAMGDNDVTAVNRMTIDSIYMNTTNAYITALGRVYLQTSIDNGTLTIATAGNGANVDIDANGGGGAVVTVEGFTFNGTAANFPDNSVVDSMIPDNITITFADSTGAITDGGVDSLDFNQTQTDAYVNLLIGPFIDTTTLDTIQNAHRAILADSAVAIPDSVVGTSFTATGAASGTITLNGATSGSQSITVADVAGTPAELVLPTDAPSDGDFLEWNTGGLLAWTAGGAGGGTSDSLRWDTSGAGGYAFTYPTVIRQGTGINLSVNVDTAYVTVDTGVVASVASVALIGDDTTNYQTAYTHSQDNTQGHSDYMRNVGDTATGHYNVDSLTALALQTDSIYLATLDYGDVTVVDGVWAVENNSHAHDSTTLSANSVGASELANSAVDSGAMLQTSYFAIPKLSLTAISGAITSSPAGEPGGGADTCDQIDGNGLRINTANNNLEVDTSGLDTTWTPAHANLADSAENVTDGSIDLADLAGNSVDSTKAVDNGISEDDIAWTENYIPLMTVHGALPADSTTLTLPRYEGVVPILCIDSTNEASAKDTVVISGVVPFDCTVDSLIFTYKVVGTSVLIDSLVLSGPDKSVYTNLCDSTYYSSGTNRTSTSAARVAIDLSSFAATGGDIFSLQFANDLAADDGEIYIYHVQLAVKQ